MTPDEEFGNGQQLLLPADWTGVKYVQVRGVKDNAVDVGIRIKMQ